MKSILTFFFLSIALLGYAQKKHTFEIKDGEFNYDGKAIKIYSGEIHYSRIPKAYWKHRLQMVRAMGLNTIATYVFWNYHNTAPGKWDFKTDNHNLREFIELAMAEGLFVILRPGPYVCGEWEFGGYPWWLSTAKGMQIRANNQPFLDSCKVYINKLAEQVKGLHITEGGPIILTQVENEFGSYVAQRKDIPLAAHQAYNHAIKTMLVESGLKPPYFTSDGSWLFEGGSTAGALPTANGEGDINNLKKVVDQYNNGKGPYMVAEFYPGWLDHWAEPFQKVSTATVIAQTEKYLNAGVNFNYYMVHGGTNFAYTSGANYDKKHDIQPDLTSYDYDAPISETGAVTLKYKAIRELMMKHVSYPVPEIPAAIPTLVLPEIKLKSLDFFEWKNQIKPVLSDTPQSFESLGQANGYVLYSKKFVQPIQGKLKISGLRDYATVYVNGERVAELNRYYNNYEADIDIPFNATLDILVESMGRINYGAQITNNLKGIISPVTINGYTITGDWQMYKAPLEEMPDLKTVNVEAKKGMPAFYSGSFKLTDIGDVFLDMAHWGKGIVFVNGHHLGRYWNVGPQQTLFLPGAWLKKGDNQVLVFDQKNDEVQSALKTSKEHILDKLISTN